MIPQRDPYTLDRFVRAQQSTYDVALREIKDGKKVTHWSWFVLPQLVGLGKSDMAQRYGISGIEEARAYLAHPVLGSRLVECARALLTHTGKSADDVLGEIDAMKLHSSATLFEIASPEGSVFQALLDRYFAGHRDERTLRLLRVNSPPTEGL